MTFRRLGLGNCSKYCKRQRMRDYSFQKLGYKEKWLKISFGELKEKI